MGDSVTNLQGVLTYSFDRWQIRSTVDGGNVFERTNPRPETPPDIGGELKMTSFNVLNFFTTLDMDDITVGTNGDAELTGADSVEEFDRQLAKLVTVFARMDLDIVALVKLENEFFTPE